MDKYKRAFLTLMRSCAHVLQHSTSTPFDHANQSSAQDIILAPTLAYMIAVNGLEGTGRF